MATMTEPTEKLHGRKAWLRTTIAPGIKREIAAKAREDGVPINAVVERALRRYLVDEYLTDLGVRR
jgi:hypothetical protein